MKLQHKLALYNTFTKIAIIAILGILIMIFIDRISTNHLQYRLIDKRNKLIENLSDLEIADLLQQQNSFTDYNLLKEEYIILTEAGNKHPDTKPPVFSQDKREIDGNEEEYLILVDYFSYGGQAYRLEIGETMQVIEQLESTISLFTLLVLVLSVSLSIAADLAFTRIILAPFYKIIDLKLNKVGDPIYYSYEPVATTTDDFLLLDNSISSLMKKISEQMLTEKQFITNVSHELLTPISILRTRIENMLNDAGLPIESQARLVGSLKILNRLKSIINSLLLISKVENQQYNKTDKISLRVIIAEIHEELADRLLEKNILLENQISHDFIYTGNRSLLHTLFFNLINNAIKYNKVDGQIVIGDELGKGYYKLLISDKGEGMDKAQIDKAFGRFEKLESADNESHGLGLAIVKSIAAFHNLDVHIDSEKGTGTTVSVTFFNA